MNTARNHTRLDALSREIAALDAMLVEAQRAALACSGSESEQALAATNLLDLRTRLDRALRAYWIENEVVRRSDAMAHSDLRLKAPHP